MFCLKLEMSYFEIKHLQLALNFSEWKITYCLEM
jgi:hypothetical protein